MITTVWIYWKVPSRMKLSILPTPQDTDVSSFLIEISNKPRLDHVFKTYVFKYCGTHSMDIRH